MRLTLSKSAASSALIGKLKRIDRNRTKLTRGHIGALVAKRDINQRICWTKENVVPCISSNVWLIGRAISVVNVNEGSIEVDDELTFATYNVHHDFMKSWNVDFDDAGAIGRRYRRQDEIGTPFCITIDFESLDDHAVTIRERDSMEQSRIALDQVEAWLAPRLLGC